ncbi:MAG: CDGSH iron-sulfur domain-containing protein [Anaerolineae bacterium]|jgi:CDGSH-type Zn-finger protein
MAEIKITGRADGPYLVKGQATYVDADGKEQTTEGVVFALCRCGQSDNKPFCDGRHRAVDFKAPVVEVTVAE